MDTYLIELINENQDTIFSEYFSCYDEDDAMEYADYMAIELGIRNYTVSISNIKDL